jgi:16S rRNA (guanine(966)-N(2))-methyltransferase RsmD
MIRVISGLYKGQRLKRVPDPAVRPMQDKLRGALFNILGDRVAGGTVLDGFAGTGSIGIEALSRGAARAVFVDEFYPAVKVIRENLARCGAESRAVVMHREFNRAVIELAGKKVGFDLIFLDPPYRLLETRNPLKVVRKRAILKPGGLLVMRHFDKVRPSEDDLPLVKRVRMGDDILSFYALPAEKAEGPTGGKGRPGRRARREAAAADGPGTADKGGA